MAKGEIGGFVRINNNGHPLESVDKEKLSWFKETYKDMTGIPKHIYVDFLTDKFYLFPYPTNDWPLRYFASNSRQLHTSCFHCEK